MEARVCRGTCQRLLTICARQNQDFGVSLVLADGSPTWTDNQRTPRTMPMGKSTPKASIWMKIWIHNVVSYYRWARRGAGQLLFKAINRRFWRRLPGMSGIGEKGQEGAGQLTIGSTETAWPSGIWPAGCSCVDAMGANSSTAAMKKVLTGLLVVADEAPDKGGSRPRREAAKDTAVPHRVMLEASGFFCTVSSACQGARLVPARRAWVGMRSYPCCFARLKSERGRAQSVAAESQRQ